jgi:hypothetical protein
VQTRTWGRGRGERTRHEPGPHPTVAGAAAPQGPPIRVPSGALIELEAGVVAQVNETPDTIMKVLNGNADA